MNDVQPTPAESVRLIQAATLETERARTTVLKAKASLLNMVVLAVLAWTVAGIVWVFTR